MILRVGSCIPVVTAGTADRVSLAAGALSLRRGFRVDAADWLILQFLMVQSFFGVRVFRTF